MDIYMCVSVYLQVVQGGWIYRAIKMCIRIYRYRNR